VHTRESTTEGILGKRTTDNQSYNLFFLWPFGLARGQYLTMLGRTTITRCGDRTPVTGPEACFGTGVARRWPNMKRTPDKTRAAAPHETALPPSWICLMFAVLLTLLLPKVAAQELCFEGTVKRRAYLFGRTHEGPNSSFTMNVKGCDWFTRVVKDQGKYSADYEEVSYDGTNVYVLINNKSGWEAQVRKGAKLGPEIAAAKVYRGEVCNLFEVEEVGPIWLSYASACYFKSRTNDFVEPPMMQDPISGVRFGPPTHFEMRAHWTLSDSTPSFPVRVAYQSEGHFVVRGKAFSLPAPYDAGLTSALYQAETFTNFLGLDVPLVSTLKIFKTRTNAVANTDLDLLIEFRVELTNVAHGRAAYTSQPPIPGLTLVRDFREPRGGELVYYATNNWPTESEILTGQHFENIRKLNAFPRVPAGALPSVVRVVLVLALLVPIVLYLLNKYLLSKRRPPN
jgi:hypothetical protein